MSDDEYIGAGEHCWIRTDGTQVCGHYLHTEPSCPNILSRPGRPKRYLLAEWAGRKPQCPVCIGIARNRMAESASIERLRPAPRPLREPAPEEPVRDP
jgi:hypothetical protein